MARYTAPRTRISRRFGTPIFGQSKYLERRNYGPGVHGPKSRRKVTDYALGLLYHLGFANTRPAARQMVSHGHIRVNGRKVNIPSCALKVNDVVEVKDSNVARQMASKNLEMATSRVVPDWLSLNKEAFKGAVARIPTRDEIQPIANEQAVVEFYSR